MNLTFGTLVEIGYTSLSDSASNADYTIKLLFLMKYRCRYEHIITKENNINKKRRFNENANLDFDKKSLQKFKRQLFEIYNITILANFPLVTLQMLSKYCF